MSKERYNQIIDDAYKNYVSTNEDFEWTDDFCKKNLKDYGDQWDIFSKEEFINKCKTNLEFSEKWGLKIEERELSLGERKRIYEMEYTNDIEVENNHWLESKLKTRNIPTKQITLTYNNETIEVYE